MKVLHLIDNFDFTDGCARAVFLLMREQKRRGPEVSIILGRGDATSLLQKENISFKIIPSIHHQNRSISQFIKGMFEIQKQIQLFRPDIVHSHHYYASNQFRKYPRFHRPAHVHTVHQNIDEGLLPLYRGDKVISVSESTQNRVLQKHPHLKNKSLVILNGIEFLDDYQSKKYNSIIGGVDNEGKVFTVLFVGRMVEAKGIFDHLEAIQDIQPKKMCRCIFVGDGVDRKKTEEYATKNNLNVFFAGHQEIVQPYYSLADVVVVPSHAFEGQPMVLLEAGLLQKPVIASNVDGIPELITHKKTGLLIEPKNVRQLSEAILALYGDPLLRHTLGENLFLKVKNDRNVKTMTDEVEQVYLSILKAKQNRVL
ncbi:MAG: glycosyltransferase family 4 protein [Bacteroidota bacterium]|nr:glycosyltransferase family 4 protein [Bacteroidota bacterium]